MLPKSHHVLRGKYIFTVRTQIYFNEDLISNKSIPTKAKRGCLQCFHWTFFPLRVLTNTLLISNSLPSQACNTASHWRWSESSLPARWGLRLSLAWLRLCPAAPRFTWVLHPLSLLLHVLARMMILRCIVWGQFWAELIREESPSLGPAHTGSCRKEDHLTAWEFYCMCMCLLTDQRHTCCAVCGLLTPQCHSLLTILVW